MSCSRNPNGTAPPTTPTQKRPSPSGSVHPTASPKLNDDTTILLENEVSHFPGRDSKLPFVNEHTDRDTDEHYCCCCS
jgi:hypothetical protein